MALSEFERLLLGRAFTRVEPKQYEPETLGIPCSHCGTVFRIVRFQECAPWVQKHETECAQRTPKERAFYAKHRRWPKRKVLAGSCEP